MTTAVEIIDRLRGLGIEIIPNPPALRLRYPKGPQPPDEARPLIEVLRSRKAEVLDALTLWDKGRERERLNTAFDLADAESRRRGIAWADAWEALPVDSRRFMDEVLDSINAAWIRRDVAVHSAALEEFRRVVASVLDTYQDLRE